MKASGLGFRGLGFRGLGFRVLGFRGLGDHMSVKTRTACVLHSTDST